MTESGWSLACLLAVVTLGEQLRFARSDAPLWVDAALTLAYGGTTLGLTASPTAAAIVTVLAATARGATGRVLRLRGADLWSGLAAVLAPYAAAWVAWTLVGPVLSLPASRLIAELWRRLSFAHAGGAAGGIRALVVVSAYAFCCGSATFLTRCALGEFAPQVSTLSSRAVGIAQAAASADPADRSLISAGRLIGNLERMLTLTLVLTGNYTALGLVIAAKSVARFELVRKHGEYFLVGTLCSIAIALAVGLVVGCVVHAS